MRPCPEQERLSGAPANVFARPTVWVEAPVRNGNGEVITRMRRPSELAPGIPRRLDDLILRCLAKERTERPHDVLVVMALAQSRGRGHSRENLSSNALIGDGNDVF
ncbi:MAG: hypothetical protein HY527_05620 [Betaproteobacteria bacterium]|nr:hypothetical protein [Betaproteobacteria bacterium]